MLSETEVPPRADATFGRVFGDPVGLEVVGSSDRGSKCKPAVTGGITKEW
jgi:hypothetical protein